MSQQTRTDTMSVDKHYVKQQAEYYIERQKKWIDEVGLKVGDKVMLVGDPDPWRLGRGLGHHNQRQLAQGEISKVEIIEDGLIGVAAVTDGQHHGANYFPFYVLLKINE